MNRLRWLWLVVVMSLFVGCKVKIVDLIPVYDFEDISIPTEHDVISISFVSDNVGFAGCHSELENLVSPYENAYYKTTNGGVSWAQITFPGASDEEVNGVSFISETVGVIMNGYDVYLTEDGGDSWVVVSSNALCVGKDDYNQLYLAERDGFFYVSIKKFNEQSHNFNSIGQMYIEETEKTGGAINGNHLHIFTDNDYGEEFIHGFDLTTLTEDHLELRSLVYSFSYEEEPTDIYNDGINFAMTTLEGLVVHSDDGEGRNVYDYHLYDYHAVDFNGDYFVAVGENTIASDITESWREVFDTSGNGFKATFYTVEFYTPTSFVVGGTDGLIYKGSME